MGADFEVSIQNGQPQLLYIDKGNKKVNVGKQLSDFDIEKKLGQGNFGSVCLVKSKLTNKLYALKEIRGEIFNENQRKEVEREIKLLEDLNHPHIIKYFTSFRENGNFYIVTEYINGGSLENLADRVHKEGKLLTEKIIWDFLIQTLSGLVYLHENKKIIHRDIKPDNLLLDKDHDLKISDFGISAVNRRDAEESVKCHGTCIGPIQFMAPEMAFEKEYDFKNDIYMLGITFFVVMSGKMPELKKEDEDGMKILRLKNFEKMIPDYYSESLKKFILKLLTLEADKRPTARKAFAEAISHYTVKFLRITSILATLNCVSSLPTIGAYFNSEKITDRIKNDEHERKYVVTKVIKNALDYANPNNFNYEKAKIECLKLRTIFYTTYTGLEKSLEVGIINNFENICNKLHRELNKCKDIKGSQMSENNAINENYLDDNGGKIDEADENMVIKFAAKKFGENFQSKISDQLYFLVKKIYQCPECQRNIKYLTTFHCAYCLRPERCALWLEKKNINIIDLFKHSCKTRQFTDINLNCKFCGKMQKNINITKKLYTSPLNLVLCFEYSGEDEFEFKIEENINLSQFVQRTDICKTNYRLVGAIFTEESDEDENNDKFVSYTKTPNGQWKYCSGNNVQNSSFNDLQNHKHIQALFYTTS